MYRLLLIPILILSLISCKREPVIKNKVTIKKVKAEIKPVDSFDYDTLQGMYSGDFGGSDIRIILNYVSHKNVIGYNIHKGLQRNLTGKVSRNKDSVQLLLSEPGDNEFDGVFTINFKGDDHAPTGKWEANDKKIPTQTFKLKKMVQKKELKEGEIDFSNFANHFDVVSDSIGDYRFLSDGLCILEYYPKNSDGKEADQLNELKGTWSLEGKTVTVNWEPNTIFAGNKIVLEIYQYNEYERVLKMANGHELYPHYY